MLDEHRQDFKRIRPNDKLVMIRANVLCNSSCVMQLTEVLLVEANGKGLDRRSSLFAHKSDDRA